MKSFPTKNNTSLSNRIATMTKDELLTLVDALSFAGKGSGDLCLQFKKALAGEIPRWAVRVEHAAQMSLTISCVCGHQEIGTVGGSSFSTVWPFCRSCKASSVAEAKKFLKENPKTENALPVTVFKQVIVLRTVFPDGKGGTFKPRTGKMAAQAAHASMKVFFDRADSMERGYLNVKLTEAMIEWVTGTFTKVVLGVDSEEALVQIYHLANDMKLPTAMIEDMGATEFHGVPTKTAVAIGPASAVEIDKITGPQGVVATRLL
jgi:PTH2 family peptidyl-tRNA hydrolase